MTRLAASCAQPASSGRSSGKARSRPFWVVRGTWTRGSRIWSKRTSSSSPRAAVLRASASTRSGMVWCAKWPIRCSRTSMRPRPTCSPASGSKRPAKRTRSVSRTTSNAASAAPRAVPWLVRAARDASTGGSLDAALSLAERGLACGAVGLEGSSLRLVQGTALSMRNQWAEAVGVSRSAMDLAPLGSSAWFIAASRVLSGGLVPRRPHHRDLHPAR